MFYLCHGIILVHWKWDLRFYIFLKKGKKYPGIVLCDTNSEWVLMLTLWSLRKCCRRRDQSSMSHLIHSTAVLVVNQEVIWLQCGYLYVFIFFLELSVSALGILLQITIFQASCFVLTSQYGVLRNLYLHVWSSEVLLYYVISCY